jgi:hypothetical protein
MRFVLSLFLCLCSSFAFAQASNSNNNDNAAEESNPEFLPNIRINYDISLIDSEAHTEASTYYYDFGGVPVGYSRYATFTLRNRNRYPIYINSINTSGMGFKQSNNCSRVMPAGGVCSINVRFRPNSRTNFTGHLDLDFTGSSDIHVHLHGRGT